MNTSPNPASSLENYFPLTVKTKAYLKPYLEALYGNPICFSFKNSVGTVIAGLLERPYKTHKSKDVIQFRVWDKFDTNIIIYFPKSWLKKYQEGHSLSEDSMIAFNKHFENVFEEDLYKFCELGRIYKVETKKSIEDFCMRHHISIEEDVTYECLKKKESRTRQTQNILKNNPPLLSLGKNAFKKII